MDKNIYCYEYPRAALTTDCVVFGSDGAEILLLLIERGNEPFKGKWAFPGGFLDMDESTEECAKRELFEETGINNVQLEQLYTFSDVNRDPRGRTVSVVYFTLVEISECKVVAGDDAARAEWFKLEDIPPLAFDHSSILKLALERLKQMKNNS